jgi:hypothetical protein
MRRYEKDGKVWYSHKVGDEWCHGEIREKKATGSKEWAALLRGMQAVIRATIIAPTPVYTLQQKLDYALYGKEPEGYGAPSTFDINEPAVAQDSYTEPPPEEDEEIPF